MLSKKRLTLEEYLKAGGYRDLLYFESSEAAAAAAGRLREQITSKDINITVSYHKITLSLCRP